MDGEGMVMSRRTMTVLPVLFALLPACPAAAGEGSSRAGLTGDWGGARTRWEQAGVSVEAELTGFANQLASGDGNDDVATTGRLDVFVDLSSDKLGWWSGGLIRTHSEIRSGDARSNFGGALLPSNTGALLPSGEDNRLVMTSLYLAQAVGKSNALLVGKINMLDLLDGDPVLGGGGTQRFQHIAFVAPPNGIVPATIMGAVFVHGAKPVSWTFMVMDPHDRAEDYWVEGLFEDGVNVSIGPTWSGTWAGRRATVGLTLAYSTARGRNLEEVLLPPGLQTGDKKGSYNIALATTYRLKNSKAQEGKGLDLYAQAATADGNPNPIQGSVTVGMAGHGMSERRPRDSFGVGAFWFDFSDDLQSSITPLVDFRDEAGLEAWYSFSVAPWFDVTADVQWLDPASGNRSSAVMVGLRGRVVF